MVLFDSSVENSSEPESDDRSTQPASNRNSRRIRQTIRIVALVLLATIGAFLLRPFYSQNLGVVDPGRAFRSAQPTSRLAGMIEELNLASILNLRGGDPSDSWYAHEVETAQKADVDFYDLPLSAVRRPTRRELLLLIDAITSAKQPLLIHCRAGADRTGLATAVYRMMILERPPEEAVKSFTAFHSHIPMFGPQRLHEPINEYAAWLQDSGLEHSPQRFRTWVRNEYQSNDPSLDPQPIRPGPRHTLRATQEPRPTATSNHSG